MKIRQALAVIPVGILLVAVSQLTSFAVEEADAARANEQYVRATRAAAESLRSNIENFQCRLKYHGVDTDERWSIHLSVAPLPDDSPARTLAVRIDKEQAAILIGHLATDGFLYRGTINREKLRMLPDEPYYELWIAAGKREQYFDELTWDDTSRQGQAKPRPPLVQQVDNFRAVLTGESGKAMDKLREALETPR